MNCNANKCIECTVKSCAYHCATENYCSLDKILVVPTRPILLWISALTASPSGRNKSNASCGGIFPPHFFLSLTKRRIAFMISKGNLAISRIYILFCLEILIYEYIFSS